MRVFFGRWIVCRKCSRWLDPGEFRKLASRLPYSYCRKCESSVQRLARRRTISLKEEVISSTGGN